MPTETLIFGPPGCGKTHTLMEIMQRELDNGTPPDRIGFVSFSKKAIKEAKTRAMSKFHLLEDDLPWFKTLHALGFAWLGMESKNVVDPADLRALEWDLGVRFDNTTAEMLGEGLIPTSHQKGNRYLSIIARAKMRCISMEQEYSDRGDYDLHWEELVFINEVYSQYKANKNKYDFTDMVELFVEQGTAPTLDVLIVDEAQDLTPLQWKQVKIIKQNSDRIWYAGDDDQCVHRWNGVEVEDFMDACDNKTVLSQSYRVPQAVFSLANSIVDRIHTRFPKSWNPMERVGDVQFHNSWYDIDIDQGSWTIMGRTNNIIKKVADQLRDDGYLYRLNERLSINEEMLEVMNIWMALADGKVVNHKALEKLYDNVPKTGDKAVVKRGSSKTLSTLDPEGIYDYNILVENHGLIAGRETPAEDIVNMSQEDRRYVAALKLRGESLTAPRIKLSTIHRMKGGEDENIILFSESCFPAVNNPEQDDEHRVFYTGITRAKENLHIVDHECKYRYEI